MATEPLVRATARRFASHHYPAEDLAQELRLKALNVGDSPILPIALKRHAIDIVTGHRNWTGHVPVMRPDAFKRSVPLEPGDDNRTYLEPAHVHSDVRAAVRSLPMRERLYVFYRFWEDRTNEDAAARAGVGKNAWGKSIRHMLQERLTPSTTGVTLQ